MSSVPSDLCVKPCCSLQGEGSAPKAGRGTISYRYVRSATEETTAGIDYFFPSLFEPALVCDSPIPECRAWYGITTI